MFKEVFKIAIICLFSIVFTSCKKIIETDISKLNVQVILPKSNDTIGSNPVHFKWLEMEGATKYRLELVQPDFENITAYILDSVVTGTNFYMALDSNKYAFKITALNAGYQSKTISPIKFVVGTSSGFNSTTVSLNSPNDGAYLNNSFNGNFSWYILPGAQKYTFELHKTNSFAGETIDYQDQLVVNNYTSLSGTSLEEGTYCWGVKAFLQNNTETNFGKHIFYIDTTSPGSTNNTMPLDNTFINAGNQVFTWTLPADVGISPSPIISIFEMATDVNFTNQLPVITTTMNTATRNLLTGTYYWRVRLKDSAGNVGPIPNDYFVLTVN